MWGKKKITIKPKPLTSTEVAAKAFAEMNASIEKLKGEGYEVTLSVKDGKFNFKACTVIIDTSTLPEKLKQ